MLLTLSSNHFIIAIVLFSSMKTGLWMMFIPNEFITYLKGKEKRITKDKGSVCLTIEYYYYNCASSKVVIQK